MQGRLLQIYPASSDSLNMSLFHNEGGNEADLSLCLGRQWVYQTCTEFGFYQSTDSPNQPFSGFPLPWVCSRVIFVSWGLFVCSLQMHEGFSFSFAFIKTNNFDLFSFSYHLQQCADIYNLSTSLDDAIQQTNEEYGGYDIRTTRIVFPNGSIDPWHALGVTRDITSDLLAVFIKGLSHLHLHLFLCCAESHWLWSLSGTAHCANMYPGPSARPSSAEFSTGPHLHPAPELAGRVIDRSSNQSGAPMCVIAHHGV